MNTSLNSSNGVQKHNRLTVGFVKAVELFPDLHIHAALIAPNSLDCDHAEAFWQSMAAPGYSDAARVEPYRVGGGGLLYTLKTLDGHREDIQFSHNLAAFAPDFGGSMFPTDARQRRNHRRIQEQLGRVTATYTPTRPVLSPHVASAVKAHVRHRTSDI